VTLAVRHGGTSDYDGAADRSAVAGARTDRTDRAEWERMPIGIAIGIGAVAVIATAFIAAAIPAGDPGWRFAVMATVVGLFAAISLDQVALAAVAAITALVTNGFIEDRAGQLAWHGSADLWKVLLLVIVGAIGLAIGEAYRYLRKLRALWRVELAVNERLAGHEGLALSDGRPVTERRTVPAKEEEHGA